MNEDLNLSNVRKETKSGVNPYLATLRKSIEEKDINNLRMIVDAIQRQVHRMPKVTIAPMNSTELNKLIKTGQGMIYVGTGTIGERIYIENGELYMPEEKDQPSSRRFYDNFRYVFELGDDEKLRVKF